MTLHGEIAFANADLQEASQHEMQELPVAPAPPPHAPSALATQPSVPRPSQRQSVTQSYNQTCICMLAETRPLGKLYAVQLPDDNTCCTAS